MIICGFPGVGKSYAAQVMGWNDSDSSRFPKDSFPDNYIKHLRAQAGIVLASTHKEVRDALAEAGVKFAVCYPERNCKREYLERYRRRGSPQAFIDLLDASWDTWIDDMRNEKRARHHIVLRCNEYLLDVIINITLPPADAPKLEVE